MDLQTYLVEMKMAPREHFRLIADRPKANPAMGVAVRGALQETSLFSFSGDNVYRIGT
ncbi:MULTISPECIES: hypothetical protein [unclassified Bradyrhizobium]|uniref:hypothetical protein n=1 Tax=Bradyrhizobium sp. USDA 4545 TaxID=2817705 RepID=UPI0020A2738D|nr:hypothetical protein [Bradyrhizobium sp. USDA 4545]MCP1833746.1 hypothetical protein [Bradyrhizobium sp. USDA 4545]MCP1918490.1 hypothetical protein [Bradyrhizobium sp. USDA 4532]